MLVGKSDLIKACQDRGMQVTEVPCNLLESRLQATGDIDGMTLDLDVHCIAGMPGCSAGAIVLKGNLGQLLAVLERLMPTMERRPATGADQE